MNNYAPYKSWPVTAVYVFIVENDAPISDFPVSPKATISNPTPGVSATANKV